jgi:DNA-binding MarR family transcriptional regulator
MKAAAKEKPRANGLDMGRLAGLMGFHLRCAQVAAFERFKELLRPHGMNPGQLGTLYLIAANPGATQSAVAGALLFDRSAMVQIIDQLEARGLVVRAAAHDRRSHALRLTEKGVKLIEKMDDAVARHETEIARELTAEERRTLVRLLSRLYSPAA